MGETGMVERQDTGPSAEAETRLVGITTPIIEATSTTATATASNSRAFPVRLVDATKDLVIKLNVALMDEQGKMRQVNENVRRVVRG